MKKLLSLLLAAIMLFTLGFSAVADENDDPTTYLSIINNDYDSVIMTFNVNADKFVADDGEKRRLHEVYGADVCEMESAGVLLTCLHAGVPCLVLKAVSDGKGGADEFKEMVEEAAEECAKVVIGISSAL